MSGLCLFALAGGALLASLPGSHFTLSWTHSIEKTPWQEEWRVEPNGLVVERARIQSTGAGMEPPEGARLVDGWWVWRPAIGPQAQVVLAASAFTGDHTLCSGGACRPLHAWLDHPPDGPVVMRPCR